MKPQNNNKNKAFLCLAWLLEGIVVGFGAILPGVSGGTLCVTFGMYRPIVETISNFKNGIKKYWLMFGVFLLGVAVGFIGLSGIATMLLEKNASLVTCAFIGFIIGTFPELWKDAGSEGRSKYSIASIVISFAAMLCILTLFKTTFSLSITPNTGSYLLCGLLWGLSFIIPGLSSSSLLLFFGLYQPMLEGISKLDFSVLIPMGIGMAACILLLSKAVGFAYKKHFSIVSHAVLGVVAASTVILMPSWNVSLSSGVINLALISGGAAVSYLFTRICDKLKSQSIKANVSSD